MSEIAEAVGYIGDMFAERAEWLRVVARPFMLSTATDTEKEYARKLNAAADVLDHFETWAHDAADAMDDPSTEVNT